MFLADSPLQVALSLLEDGIAEENLSTALAASQAHLGLADAELPFAVAE